MIITFIQSKPISSHVPFFQFFFTMEIPPIPAINVKLNFEYFSFLLLITLGVLQMSWEMFSISHNFQAKTSILLVFNKLINDNLKNTSAIHTQLQHDHLF